MYKVNTLKSFDIKQAKADGSSKPYIKIYKNGFMVQEVKYQREWRYQSNALKSAFFKHDKSHLERRTLLPIKNQRQFDRAMLDADDKVIAIMYHYSNDEAV